MYNNDLTKPYYYPGAIHIHTKFSDGSGDIQQITKAAKKAGLKWIIITDHNNLEIEEGFYNGICVIKGEEISPQTSNHYLALGINKVITPCDNPEIYIEEVKKQGGFGFAAHPDEADNRKNKANPIKWTDKTIIPDGIEIWNWFSDWADNYDETNILKIAYSYFCKNKLIKGPHSETLKWWDDLNNKTNDIIPAIGGVDAHALKISKYIIPLKVFPYKCMFKTVTNLLQLDELPPKDFNAQKALILKSIKSGNNIIINRHIRDEIPIIKVCDKSLIIKLSFNAEMRIVYNGSVIHKTINKFLNYKLAQQGKYRVEIYINKSPWIFSNPFIIT